MKKLCLFLLALVCSVGQAFAQLPPIPPIADTDRYQFAVPISSLSSMSINFPVFGDGTDIVVKVGGAPLDRTLWTFSSASGAQLNIIPLPVTDGKITFNPAITSGSLVEVFGAWHPRQVVQSNASGINRREFNQAISTIVSGMRELYSGINAGRLVLAAGSLSLSTLAPVPAYTFVGNPTAVSASPSTLTSAQALALLSVGTIATQGGYGTLTTVASASTVDLGLITSHNASVTGTTSITSFGSSAAAGTPNYQVAFTGALTLTYNVTSLILPTGANITTAAGDVATLTYLGLGNWKVVDYQTASGQALVTPIVSAQTTNIRQTVLSGPIVSGVSSLFPTSSVTLSITSQGISGSAPIIATASVGYGANGNVDVFSQSTANLTWSALTPSVVNYLGVTISGGVLTPINAVALTYQYGGTLSVTANAYTYDISQMKMFVGNGSTANQTSAVFVGEVLTSGTAVSSTFTYAYNGYYDSGFISTLPGLSTFTSKNSNLGQTDQIVRVQVKNLTAEGGFAIGDVNENFGTVSSNPSYTPMPVTSTRNTSGFATGNAVAFSGNTKTNGAYFIMTAANWAYRIIARRAWGGS